MAEQQNPKYVRKTSKTDDAGDTDSLEYSVAAGAKKVSDVGHHLRPIQSGATTWTLSLATAVKVGAGKSLAIYNNSGTAGTVTFGDDNTVTSIAVGTVVVDNAGVICAPNAWTYLNSYSHPWAISSGATLLCYLIEDTTYITDQNGVNKL